MEEYKIRFCNEYNDLQDKVIKLKKLLVDYQAGLLDFQPNCPYNLLHTQYVFMQAYLNVLEERMKIENIKMEG